MLFNAHKCGWVDALVVQSSRAFAVFAEFFTNYRESPGLNYAEKGCRLRVYIIPDNFVASGCYWSTSVSVYKHYSKSSRWNLEILFVAVAWMIQCGATVHQWLIAIGLVSVSLSIRRWHSSISRSRHESLTATAGAGHVHFWWRHRST